MLRFSNSFSVVVEPLDKAWQYRIFEIVSSCHFSSDSYGLFRTPHAARLAGHQRLLAMLLGLCYPDGVTRGSLVFLADSFDFTIGMHELD